ncbi:Protein of unknown function [Lentzea xinjiangensis]|uniref:DUF3558 domain-containing protein n=1 Tax=Lentzea xinjiangensis TaxID=402600 RepID=A0A1H9AIW4_9PSEU|nr:DUF3558 domain-containing protein [Lentzea xinjiangensis]SEP76712.1 Protein of unknown function [Lentzea xinjiangensis]
MIRSICAIAAVVSVLVTGSACTSNGIGGTPSPTSGGSTPSSSANPDAEVPARPADLKLNGVDPCKLLTAPQMTAIAVAEAVPDQVEVSDLGKQPGCFYENGLKYTYTVVGLTNRDIRSWLNGGGNTTSKLIDVAGFGAAEIVLTGTEGVNCSVAVDVSEGQALYVNYSPTTQKGESQDQLCGNAKKASALAVETLKTLK